MTQKMDKNYGSCPIRVLSIAKLQITDEKNELQRTTGRPWSDAEIIEMWRKAHNNGSASIPDQITAIFTNARDSIYSLLVKGEFDESRAHLICSQMEVFSGAFIESLNGNITPKIIIKGISDILAEHSDGAFWKDRRAIKQEADVGMDALTKSRPEPLAKPTGTEGKQ